MAVARPLEPDFFEDAVDRDREDVLERVLFPEERRFEPLVEVREAMRDSVSGTGDMQAAPGCRVARRLLSPR